ncbi:MAG TPA: hypothetical protein VFE13_03240, partial [Caulobacteraceae bacterium]|nr:hypothetical protein [Caulobacteraceae bacterium]
GTTVLAGGTERILGGGRASATVLSGGAELDFGQASGTVILSGGHENVFNHAVASGSMVRFGGRENVASGGVAVGAAVSGGTLTVSAGGRLLGGLSLHGGKAIISGAMAAGQSVAFTGTAGVLELDNLPAFHAAISGLATSDQKVDLGGFSFSVGETATWVQSGTSGTLSVVDGAKSASLTLIGTYVTGDFKLTDDGHGGTFVADPPPAAARSANARQADPLVAAMAGLRGGRAAGLLAAHAGPTERSPAAPVVAAAMSGR